MQIIKKKSFTIYIVFTFIVMCVFYVHLHPAYMSSLDDWTYISYLRQAWPMRGEWNPGKVFPETIGGLIGNIAGIAIYPITGDYVKTIAATYGIVFAMAVSIYVYFFGKMAKKLFALDKLQQIFVAFVFFFSHFQITKVSLHNNNYLFYTGGITMGINYFLPELLGAMLVFYLVTQVVENRFWGKDHEEIKEIVNANYLFYGVLILLLYLAEFSNLMIGGVIMSFIGISFLYRLIEGFRTKSIKGHIISYLTYITTFLMYLLCAVFETTGGRASMFETLTLREMINNTIKDIGEILGGTNKTFMCWAIALSIVALVLSAYKGDSDLAKKYRLTMALFFGAFVINVIYLILMTLRLAGYLRYYSVYNSLLIWIIMLMSVSVAYIVRRIEQLKLAFPIISFVLVFCMLNIPDNVGNGFGLGDRLYFSNKSDALYYEDDSDMVQQFVEADKSGKKSFVLYSRVYSGESGKNVALRIRRTLLRHGLIKREIEIGDVVNKSD